MLKEINFDNYRCFDKSKLSFKDLSIIVGKNNSGKSTIVEALRLISAASKKSKKAVYTTPVPSLGLPLAYKGFKIDVQKLKIDLRGIRYFYNESKNATINAIYSNGTKIVVYLNSEVAFACLYDDTGSLITRKKKAEEYEFDKIDILPQIGLIKENEPMLSKETIVTDKNTYLSSRHFRNELLINKEEYFSDFCEIVEATWSGLRIRDLCYSPSEDEYIQLYVEDAGFSAEIGLMGSGLQMWMQIIWFICRTKGSHTVILDEPDVYMHPDMQRKILRIVRSRYEQVIIATHSVEIIAEVEPTNIVTVDKSSRQMTYANSLKAVQIIVDEIGGVQNLSLLRIGNIRKCLFVEGKDIEILSQFYSILYPENDYSLFDLPCISLGGWSKLPEAFGAAKLFYEETQGEIQCSCIIDHDYYLNEILLEKKERAAENHLDLFVWARKEIENYIIIPRAIFRITELEDCKYDDFLKELENLIDEFEDDILDQISNQIYLNDRALAHSTCNKRAREFVVHEWNGLSRKIELISGKEAVKKINQWIKQKYGKSCSISKIMKNIKSEEIDTEIIDVLNAITSQR